MRRAQAEADRCSWNTILVLLQWWLKQGLSGPRSCQRENEDRCCMQLSCLALHPPLPTLLPVDRNSVSLWVVLYAVRYERWNGLWAQRKTSRQNILRSHKSLHCSLDAFHCIAVNSWTFLILLAQQLHFIWLRAAKCTFASSCALSVFCLTTLHCRSLS